MCSSDLMTLAIVRAVELASDRRERRLQERRDLLDRAVLGREAVVEMIQIDLGPVQVDRVQLERALVVVEGRLEIAERLVLDKGEDAQITLRAKKVLKGKVGPTVDVTTSTLRAKCGIASSFIDAKMSAAFVAYRPPGGKGKLGKFSGGAEIARSAHRADPPRLLLVPPQLRHQLLELLRPKRLGAVAERVIGVAMDFD